MLQVSSVMKVLLEKILKIECISGSFAIKLLTTLFTLSRESFYSMICESKTLREAFSNNLSRIQTEDEFKDRVDMVKIILEKVGKLQFYNK